MIELLNRCILTVMGKDNKIVLIFDEDPDNEPTYNSALVGHGYHVFFESNTDDFFKKAVKLYPDILVVNSKTADGDALVRKIQKQVIFKNMGLVYLLEKIVFATESRMKSLGIENFIELPLNSHELLKSIKKASKTFALPCRDVASEAATGIGTLRSTVTEISETEFTVHSPVWIGEGLDIQINAPFLSNLSIEAKLFKAGSDGVFIEEKKYRNQFLLKGLCVDVLQGIKAFCIQNRSKN